MITKKNFYLVFSILIASIFFIRPIKADYIYMKDGSIMSGVLVEEKDRLFIYRVPYGEMFINRENVSKIVRESRDKPLLREAKIYFKDKKYVQVINTCKKIREIKPDSVEALELSQTAIKAWKKYESEKKERIRRRKERLRREKEERERRAMQKALKDKWGIRIKKEKNNYIIANVYSNCPSNKKKIKSKDIVVATINDTEIAGLSIKEVYNLLLTSEEINLTVHKSVVLTRKKMKWRGTKKYVGLGISIEKVEKGIKITNLMPDGPSGKAGVLKGDIIISLKGQSISSSSMDEIIKLLKGSAGTSLKAIIEREVSFRN